jgi:DNA replication protein DnaC
MTNFDFHNLLFPTEFERFCLDIIKVKEPELEFRTFGEWADNGIDLLCISEDKNIIGQCKRYNQNNFNSLRQSLKKEVKKCKKQKPERYILFISASLGEGQFRKIVDLFEHYLKKDDIIDGERLNGFLRDEKNYGHIFKSHSKLLVPNFQSIELALDKVVHRKFYQKTTYFLHEIEAKHRLFHHTAQLPFLIQQLEENKVIILTGNPGVGKTTTAMMIANYFLSKKVKDMIFLEERDYADTLSIAEEDRLIVVDDFWGQNFSPQIKSHSTFQREFQTIIKHFTNSRNCFLILTSRDYVIRDAFKGAEFETQTMLNINKHIINIEDLSNEDKVKFLLNHLLFYDFDLSYFQNAQYNDTFEHIIKHQNYSPRHLDFFIKKYLNEDDQSSYAFYESLFKYLDNPTEFWNEAFQKLNPTAKTILLILLVSGDPMDIDDLKTSFNDIQIKAREILNEGIIPADFDKELKKLEEFYISINQDEYYYGTSIEFQSPGIKDYLLEFLRNEGYLWIHPIISKARFFNQLNFVFSTKEEKISDYESDVPLYGQKILLNEDLKGLLKQKLIIEFNSLSFCNDEGKELTDELTRYHTNDETKYFKLIELNRLFPIERNENRDVRNFILDRVLADINSFDDNRKVVAHRSMIYFPGVIKCLLPYLETSPHHIIRLYYDSITFATEYEDFYKFKEIYPLEFHMFYDHNIQRIRKHIKTLIFDDIDYYLDQDEGKIGIELDSLLMRGIEELCKQYNFRLTERYIRELETTFEINLSSLRKEKEPRKKAKHHASKLKQKEEEYKPKPYASIIKEYLPAEEEDYKPIIFLKTYGYTELLKDLKKNKSALSSLKDAKEIFESTCHFIVEKKLVTSKLDTYQLIEKFFNYHCDRIRVHPELFIKAAYKIIEGLEQSGHYSATKSTLVQAFKEVGTQKIRIEDFNPILIPYKNWYRFGHPDIQTYIIAKYIDCFEGDQFSKLVSEFLLEPNDHRILQFLQSANNNKIWTFYLIPELERLLGCINFTNQQTVLISFIDFFNIEFELAWEKKKFDSFSASNSESHYENLLHFCGIDFYVSDFETYFEEDYQHSDTFTKLSINTKIMRKLYKRVIETAPQKESQYLRRGDSVTIFEIKLSDFLKTEENYTIANNIGMVSYIYDTIHRIRKIIECKKVE